MLCYVMLCYVMLCYVFLFTNLSCMELYELCINILKLFLVTFYEGQSVRHLGFTSPDVKHTYP